MFYGFVCVLDALGTKGIWEKVNPVERVLFIELLKNLARSLIVEKYSDEHDKPTIIFFSDTVLFTQVCRYVDDLSIYMLYHKFIVFISIFMCTAFLHDIFYRGVLTDGFFFQKDELIIGPAIDEAASCYEKTNWMGVFLTDSATKTLKELLMIPESEEHEIDKIPFYIHNEKFKIPFKENYVVKSDDLVSLNWVYWLNKLGPTSFPEIFKSKTTRDVLLDKLSNISNEKDESIILKHENTIKFFDYCTSLFPPGKEYFLSLGS